MRRRIRDHRKNKSNRRLYFAYGSNLHIDQMRSRCPTSIAVGRWSLKDWKLVFRGCADIIPMVGSTVEGALYDVGPRDVSALDHYEGVGKSLYRQIEIDDPETGQRFFFYRMNDESFSPPSDAYLDIIVGGFTAWNISCDSLEEAVYHAWENRPQREWNSVFDNVETVD